MDMNELDDHGPYLAILQAKADEEEEISWIGTIAIIRPLFENLM